MNNKVNKLLSMSRSRDNLSDIQEVPDIYDIELGIRSTGHYQHRIKGHCPTSGSCVNIQKAKRPDFLSLAISPLTWCMYGSLWF